MKPTKRTILRWIALATIIALTAVAWFLAITFAAGAALLWLRVAAKATNIDTASEIGVYSVAAAAIGFVAYWLVRVIRSLTREPRQTTGGIAIARPAWPGRTQLINEHGADVVALAEEMSARASHEDTSRTVELLGEQVRTGARLRPSEGVIRHEAGHALVAVEVGFHVTEIRIAPTNGHIIAAEVGTAITPDERWDALTVLVAGTAAYDDAGCENELTRAVALATTMLINGERPIDYTAELSIGGLISGARDRAREILARRADTYDRLVASLRSVEMQYFALRGDRLATVLTNTQGVLAAHV